MPFVVFQVFAPLQFDKGLQVMGPQVLVLFAKMDCASNVALDPMVDRDIASIHGSLSFCFFCAKRAVWLASSAESRTRLTHAFALTSQLMRDLSLRNGTICLLQVSYQIERVSSIKRVTSIIDQSMSVSSNRLVRPRSGQPVTETTTLVPPHRIYLFCTRSYVKTSQALA